MTITVTVSADVETNARAAAVNLAYAQGYRSVQPLFVRPAGPRTYTVTLMVSR